MVKDMTNGSVTPILIKFSLPLLVSVIFKQMYSIADSMIAGQCINNDALSAIGVSYPITMIFLAIGYGMNIGCSVIISTFFGAKNYTQMKTAVYTSLISTGVLAAILTIAGYLTSGLFLNLLGTDKSIFSDAQTYLNIYSFGLLFLFIYDICTGIFTALGDSKTPLLFLSVAAVLNTVLDLLSVLVLHMGVAGVALSTVIAQLVSWLFGIFHINRKYPDFAVHPLRFRCKKELLLAVLRIGLPTGLQQATVAFGMIFCVAKINSFGEAYTASYNVGNKIDNFAWLAIQSLSIAVTSFVGQNVGAGKYERAQKGIRTVIVMVLLCCALFMAIILPLRHEIVGFFSKNSDTIKAGGEYLWFIMWGYPMLAVMFCLNSAMRGAGESFFPMVCTIFSMIVTRLPLLYYIADRYGPQNMYLSYDIGWAIGFAAVLIYYFSGRWKRRGRPAADTRSDGKG